jgi:hypothetical protein
MTRILRNRDGAIVLTSKTRIKQNDDQAIPSHSREFHDFREAPFADWLLGCWGVGIACAVVEGSRIKHFPRPDAMVTSMLGTLAPPV